VTEADLREAFGAPVTVQTASIIKDKFSGESRGFGFVERPNREEAQKAIAALNGKDLKGRSLKVNEAQPRAERPRGGSGFSREDSLPGYRLGDRGIHLRIFGMTDKDDPSGSVDHEAQRHPEGRPFFSIGVPIPLHGLIGIVGHAVSHRAALLFHESRQSLAPFEFVAGHTQDDQSSGGMLFLNIGEVGDILYAGRAPGSPELDEIDGSRLEFRKRFALDPFVDGKSRRRAADLNHLRRKNEGARAEDDSESDSEGDSKEILLAPHGRVFLFPPDGGRKAFPLNTICGDKAFTFLFENREERREPGLIASEEVGPEVRFRDESKGLSKDGLNGTRCQIPMKRQGQNLRRQSLELPAQLGVTAPDRDDGKTERMEDPKDLSGG
jgi:hypothetical protein